MHAHISTESADCDGRYSRTGVITRMNAEDDWDFRASVIGNALSYADADAQVQFTEWGFSVHTPTDEGFSYSEYTWCTDDDENEKSTFRDHRAESMGY